MVDDTAEGVALHLKDAFQTTITNGKNFFFRNWSQPVSKGDEKDPAYLGII